MSERWLPVVGFGETHEVSDKGRVRSLDRKITHTSSLGKHFNRAYPGRILKQKFKDNHGVSYFRVKLTASPVERTAWVHTLMLEAFVGPRVSGLEAAHCDGDSRNNVLTNLRWKTTHENYMDRVKHGTQVLKVTPAQVRAIRKQYTGTVTQHQLAERYGISQTQVGRILRRARWAAV